jgi:hypothetical protein
MRLARCLAVAVIAGTAVLTVAPPARAVSPRNPYRSFNLSGINYGSMQWERAQQQGKRVWPYYNTPSRGSSRSGTVAVGGFTGAGGGAIIQGGGGGGSSRRGLFRRR